jgi:hypothetical protein
MPFSVPRDAAAVATKEWTTAGFGASSKTRFEERLKQDGLDEGRAHYLVGGGNTPYVFGDWAAEADDAALEQWREFHSQPGPYRLGPDSLEPAAGVPRGKVKAHHMPNSSVYPETSHEWWSYAPPNYVAGTPAPVLFFCDGSSYMADDGACCATNVLDNLTHSGEIPPTIAVFLSPGVVLGPDGKPHPDAASLNQRGYEYDSITSQFAEFLLADVIPALKAEAGLTVTDDPEWRGITGISSSGVAAFAACWNRPDAFRKVISHVVRQTFTPALNRRVYARLN